MKKLIKLFTLVMAIALAFSVTACDTAEKTATRRTEYLAKATEYIETVDETNYTADAWALVEEAVANYEKTIASVAAKSKMDAAYREFVAQVGAIETIADYVNKYVERVDTKIQEALEEVLKNLDKKTMGISNVTYNEEDNKATFLITNPDCLIRKFADTGVCAIFQEMFFTETDFIEEAVVTNNETGFSNTFTKAHLTDKAGLKHHVGELFIKLFVEDYAYAPLTYLVGQSASAEVRFTFALSDGTAKTETVSFSCEFILVE